MSDIATRTREKSGEPVNLGKASTLFGVVFLLTSAALSVLLGLSHILATTLPGCGPNSGCAQAAASRWGMVPVIQWPVSFVASAYFLAALAAWLMSGGRLSERVRWLVWLGAAVSAMYLMVSIGLRLVCPYCIGANLANLAFAATVWKSAGLSMPVSRKPSRSAPWAMTVAMGVFVLASAALGVADGVVGEAARAKAQRELAESTRRLTEQADRSKTATTDAAPGGAGFTGRWHRGPNQSPVRIVVLTDYQCQDCKRVEGELEELVRERPEISLSIKHFPLCLACNRMMTQEMHGNACAAARAAEAAGMLGGADGFWRMHRWLFERGGSFDDEELKRALPGLGFEPAAFVATLDGPATLATVKADIEDGIALGLHFTPMILINGIELRGWTVPGAVRTAVMAVLARNPPPAGPENDRPPAALEKAVEDWRQQPQQMIGLDARRYGFGAPVSPEPKVRVVVYGDLQDALCCKISQQLRALIAGRESVIRFEFRQFPMNRGCNPNAPRDQYPESCLAAKGAEAAGLLRGEEGWRAMHEWLVNNRERLTEQALRDGAPAMALTDTDLFAIMGMPMTGAIIAADVSDAMRLALRELPSVFVNGRLVPRLEVAGQSVLARVLEEAAR